MVLKVLHHCHDNLLNGNCFAAMFSLSKYYRSLVVDMCVTQFMYKNNINLSIALFRCKSYRLLISNLDNNNNSK